MAYMDDTQWISESKDNLEAILEIHQPLNYNLQLNFGNQQIAIKPLRPSQSTRILAHNFKGVSINNPSFANNNTVWTVFWIDKFNKSFAGKNIHKDAKNKKIYVQHYQVDQRRFGSNTNSILRRTSNQPQTARNFKDLYQQAQFLYYFRNNFKESCSMSLGFAQACDSSPKVIFTSACQHWPSSYRAESLAILAALIVSPSQYDITIQ
ncbi:hypothetical protein GLOIN_2v1770976 [Rhizophagus irregularis DAOM 181602=DAOM 197198]|uniref:Uncharacterized protein n=2 Tax=Rhizophagus irregularis TaxID=588596 RepID=A0A2P4QAR1_RHIID|nr:hypothetical protein GLOIN_2v1770976 [Rhizophagus irregularis DAOM 181602=DAOM 197198]POG74725.1 hypothetical protein GLOIN_2v1770976 [Rhizophagus irregularis DAOM 181602=DAOM 197198]|eukprot:XP_025181591.1 hypothetical protein GLOIN_2v1770976 [Rhizophagus irregularis DAOM 181602=DAOM 197198]